MEFIDFIKNDNKIIAFNFWKKISKFLQSVTNTT